MLKLRPFHYFVAAILTAGALSSPVLAQKGNEQKPADPKDKPIKVRPEPDDVFKKWLSNEGSYIATPPEIKAYKLLTTNEERENFIATFWRLRDPNPDTDENEYREAYYERIAYANEHFSSGIPGWKTDRGRIYIMWGKPDSVETHPTGGAYNRPSYEGGGSTTTYPFETWSYRHLDNVGDGLDIEFVDPTGTGEYRLARDPNEKDALLHIPGAGQTTAEQMGLANKADRIAGISGAQQLSYQREQDSPFRRMDILIGLATPPAVKFADLDKTLTDSAVIDNTPLPFDLRIDFFRQSDNMVITAFTVQANNKELKFEQAGGLERATMNIFGRITAVSGKKSGFFEDSVTTTATSLELAEAGRKSVYQKAVALPPGTYKVGVVVRDVATGNKGVVNMGFVVPRYDENKLSTSSMVLTSKLRPTDNDDFGRMFVIGGTKVVPNLSAVYKQGQEVGVYMQVYNAGIDQSTLRPAVDVDYILVDRDGKEIIKKPEDWSGMSDAGPRLTLARLLPTATLAPGDYGIKIQIRDRVGAEHKAIESTAKFTITK